MGVNDLFDDLLSMSRVRCRRRVGTNSHVWKDLRKLGLSNYAVGRFSSYSRRVVHWRFWINIGWPDGRNKVIFYVGVFNQVPSKRSTPTLRSTATTMLTLPSLTSGQHTTMKFILVAEQKVIITTGNCCIQNVIVFCLHFICLLSCFYF